MQSSPEGAAHLISYLRELIPDGSYLYSEEPEHEGSDPKYPLAGDAVWMSRKQCEASRSEFLPHTCGLEKTVFMQGNRHSHDGEPCKDWAHCSRTSDEQKAMQ